jgi:hypothetical protein
MNIESWEIELCRKMCGVYPVLGHSQGCPVKRKNDTEHLFSRPAQDCDICPLCKRAWCYCNIPQKTREEEVK